MTVYRLVDIDELETLVSHFWGRPRDDARIDDLCAFMGVSRGSYYRARQRGGYPWWIADEILTRVGGHLCMLPTPLEVKAC